MEIDLHDFSRLDIIGDIATSGLENWKKQSLHIVLTDLYMSLQTLYFSSQESVSCSETRCNCIMLDFVHPNLRKGVGQSFLTSRFARNEIDFFSPLNSKVTQLVNCTWKLPEPLEDAFDLCIFVKIDLSHCLCLLFLNTIQV